jgi:hypothetical protein
MDKEFTPKYNAVAAMVMFDRALARGDMDEAESIARICIDAQERDDA